MKINDLINELLKYDPDEDIIATWESITRKISVYQAKDGTVMIDADENHYREDFIDGRLNPKKWIYNDDED